MTVHTYSLLGDRQHPPSEYEIVTSRLHAYVERGFEVSVPLASWYARYQAGSPFQCPSWDEFFDPRETTYTKYTRLQAAQEREIDALLEDLEARPHGAWVPRIGLMLSALRFPCHGFHMIASYIGQMAPSGRVTMAALFQAADELRRIDRLAYTIRLLDAGSELADAGRAAWQHEPAWQPLRATVEHLLVAYDWGEALVGLDLCVKPIVDDLFTVHAARVATAIGAVHVARMLAALRDDCLWQRAWSIAAVRCVLAQTPRARTAVEGWIARWRTDALAAVHALANTFVDDPAAAVSQIAEAHSAMLHGAGLSGGA
jgi:toluene monooxygenase system protein E